MTKTIEKLQQYLAPTKLINSLHPEIIQKAGELTVGTISTEEKARRIFYFIRDEVRYVFRAQFEEEKYFASQILKNVRGFCTQKAILFCALARSCGIAAGIYFYDIVDFSLPQNFVNLLKTRTLYRHGIAVLFINGKWIKYDATLDSALTGSNNLHPVEFSPVQDCLMNPKTRTGARHIDYIKDYGLYSDVTFEEIVSWFKQNYPHLKI